MLELTDEEVIPPRPPVPAGFGNLDAKTAFKPGGKLYEQIMASGERVTRDAAAWAEHSGDAQAMRRCSWGLPRGTTTRCDVAVARVRPRECTCCGHASFSTPRSMLLFLGGS